MPTPIRLLRDQLALVDDEDYDALSVYSWRLNSKGYAIRSFRHHGRVVVLNMHRDILQPPPHLVVDHIDGDKLNNTRANLRLITQQESLMHRRCFRNNELALKGVSALHGRWRARIYLDGQAIHLGLYNNPET